MFGTKRVFSPEGEEFKVETRASNRILKVLNKGVPFSLGNIEEGKLIIKEGDYFLFTNLRGDIPKSNMVGYGFYFKDTRFLNYFTLKINGERPIVLLSTSERDYIEHLELTNSDLELSDKSHIPQDTLNIRRLRVIKDGLYERIRIKNYNPVLVKLSLEFGFGADFADIFEMRGLKRKKRGKILKPKISDKCLRLAYLGLDGIFRRTEVHLGREPNKINFFQEKVSLIYEVEIEPHGRIIFDFFIEPVIGEDRKEQLDFNKAVSILRKSYDEWERKCTQIFTDNELFNTVIKRAQNDLRELVALNGRGEIIYGGVPWFSAPFGRDSLITSLQTLSLNPNLSKETLKSLSFYQGKKVDPWRDEEPGKIFHEIRQGELAQLDEIPHTPYYGSIDSTPLFLVLFSEYLNWTGDLRFIYEERESINAALNWIDRFGDVDGDLFIEYERKSSKGLTNQGWKDSWDAVVHQNGRFPVPPIALVEVQGYVYLAKSGLSKVYRILGESEKSQRLEKEAEELKKKFNQLFWLEEESYFALALDGEKQPVKAITSNPGQGLWAEIIEKEKAEKVVKRLLQPDMFSGWGIRTLSKSAKGYNPMSYHNGSVWPHDNSMIIAGMKKYQFGEEANLVGSALFDAAIHHPYFRLPELFCGFTRRGNNYPVTYPVACTPQAWAAGSIFLILQSILGFQPDALNNILYLNQPQLPSWLNRVEISNLRVGRGNLRMLFIREGKFTRFEVSDSEGGIEVKILE